MARLDTDRILLRFRGKGIKPLCDRCGRELMPGDEFVYSETRRGSKIFLCMACVRECYGRP